MSNAVFGVDYSNRTVKCKDCALPIEKGNLRLKKQIKAPLYYHPGCIFKSFSRIRKSTQVIGDISDIDGIDGLEDPDKNHLVQLIQTFKASRSDAGQQPGAAGPSTSAQTVLAVPTVSSPLPQPSSTQDLTASSSSEIKTSTPVRANSATASTSSDIKTCIPVSVITQVNQSSQSAAQSWTAVLQAGMGNLIGPTASPILISSDESDEEVHSQANNEECPNKKLRLDDNPSTSTCDNNGKQSVTPQVQKLPSASIDGSNTTSKGCKPKVIVDSDVDECCVCLDPPVHPVTLPCGHIYCYLCAKGLVMANMFSVPLCSLCRRQFPKDYLGSAVVLHNASQELNDTPPIEVTEQVWQWFYEGRKGWWRFETRNNEELEENFLQGVQTMETMICGNLYTINFATMEQYQTNFPNRKRRIKRDLKSSDCKGVAGLAKRSWNKGSPDV